MSVKLLTKHHLEFLSLKGGCAGSSESTFVKMPYCWKSHVVAQFILMDYPIHVDTIAHFSDKLDHERGLKAFPHYSRKCICEMALFQHGFVAA